MANGEDPPLQYHLSDRLYNQRTFYIAIGTLALVSSGMAMKVLGLG